mgnify:CR=1 FL=1
MEEMNRKADAVFMTETLFDGQTEQGVELDHVLPVFAPLSLMVSSLIAVSAVMG